MTLRLPALLPAMLLAALSAPPPALAEEFDGVAAPDLLSDEDFFRLATCGARPGDACAGPVIRWPGDKVTLSLLPAEVPPPAGFTAALDKALAAAIAEINAVGAGMSIRRVDGARADIRVMPTALVEGTVMDDDPGISAAGVMGVGYMSYWWNDRSQITAATVLISTAITDQDLQSVVLEELFQTLGPRFDIEGAAYEGVSILSQSSNATEVIEGQDARLLRWLYPLRQ